MMQGPGQWRPAPPGPGGPMGGPWSGGPVAPGSMAPGGPWQNPGMQGARVIHVRDKSYTYRIGSRTA